MKFLHLPVPASVGSIFSERGALASTKNINSLQVAVIIIDPIGIVLLQNHGPIMEYLMIVVYSSVLKSNSTEDVSSRVFQEWTSHTYARKNASVHMPYYATRPIRCIYCPHILFVLSLHVTSPWNGYQVALALHWGGGPPIRCCHYLSVVIEWDNWTWNRWMLGRFAWLQASYRQTTYFPHRSFKESLGRRNNCSKASVAGSFPSKCRLSFQQFATESSAVQPCSRA